MNNSSAEAPEPQTKNLAIDYSSKMVFLLIKPFLAAKTLQIARSNEINIALRMRCTMCVPEEDRMFQSRQCRCRGWICICANTHSNRCIVSSHSAKSQIGLPFGSFESISTPRTEMRWPLRPKSLLISTQLRLGTLVLTNGTLQDL